MLRGAPKAGGLLPFRNGTLALHDDFIYTSTTLIYTL